MTDETEPTAPEESAAPVEPEAASQPFFAPYAAPDESLNPMIREVRARGVDEEGGVHRPRTDEDVRIGQFADVVDGPHHGRYVVYIKTIDSLEDGYPKRVLVRSRDARDEDLIVPYAYLRPAPRGGRR